MDTDKLKELEKQEEEIRLQIERLRKEEKLEKIKNNEERFLGKCYRKDGRCFKVMSAISENECWVSGVYFYESPEIKLERMIGLRNRYYDGEIVLEFMQEDSIFLRELNTWEEISEKDFEKKMRESFEKILEKTREKFKIEK